LDRTPTVADYTQTLQLTAGVPDAVEFDERFGPNLLSVSAAVRKPQRSPPKRYEHQQYDAQHGCPGNTTGVCSTSSIPSRRLENRRIQMRLALSSALLASALLCLSACNKAESPDKVQADVAKAQSDAAEANAKADEKQKQVEAEAAKDRADAQVKAADKSVGALADSAVTQAEGETKVALAKCEALEGDAQKACKDQANAHMDAVKEKAKAAKSD
jgi:hypothetical protein